MRYRTIVADPPWRYTKNPSERDSPGRGASAEHYYSTMTNSEIGALPVAELAADDAHLYMWVTNPVLLRYRQGTTGLPDPVDIVRGWGFEPKALLTWVKEGPPGLGWWYRGHTEHVIFAVRGNPIIPTDKRRSNVFAAPRSQHSAKPECFIDMVEQVSLGPYVEMFARRARFGWDYWGDQSLGTAELAAARP